MTQIATLTQKPVIDFSKLEEIGAKVKADLAQYNFSELVVTEENVKGIKELRTRLKKEFELAESARKEIKKNVNDPYAQFDAAYKTHIASSYTEADSQLKKAIDEVENGIRLQKKKEVEELFNDLCQSNDITFLTFDKVGLNITLSASMKSLKDAVHEFIDKTVSDLSLIETQEHSARIRIDYEKTLNVSQSIITVTNAVKQEEELKARQEQARLEAEKRQAELEAQKSVEAVAPVEVVQPIAEEPKPIIEEVIQEQEITITFAVTGTKDKIIKVREYMKELGLKYE